MFKDGAYDKAVNGGPLNGVLGVTHPCLDRLLAHS